MAQTEPPRYSPDRGDELAGEVVVDGDEIDLSGGSHGDSARLLHSTINKNCSPRRDLPCARAFSVGSRQLDLFLEIAAAFDGEEGLVEDAVRLSALRRSKTSCGMRSPQAVTRDVRLSRC